MNIFVCLEKSVQLRDDIINFISNDTEYKILHMPHYKDRAFCRQLFLNKSPLYKWLTEYARHRGKEMIKCKKCKTWNDSENSHNNCCDDNNIRCSSSERWIVCQECHVFIQYDYNDKDNKDIKHISVWKPSGNVLLIKKGMPYRHLQSNRITYKRAY